MVGFYLRQSLYGLAFWMLISANAFQKETKLLVSNNRPGRNLPRFRDAFLTKANGHPLQKACGGVGCRRFCGKTCRPLPENVGTFRGKRAGFPAKLPELIRRIGEKMRFGRNCNRFSCGIFLGNFRSEVPERNGLCLQMRFEVSVSLVWRI